MVLKNYGISHTKLTFVFKLSQSQEDEKNDSQNDGGSLARANLDSNHYLIDNLDDYFSVTKDQAIEAMRVASTPAVFKCLSIMCEGPGLTGAQIKQFLNGGKSYKNRILRSIKLSVFVRENDKKLIINNIFLTELNEFLNLFNYE